MSGYIQGSPIGLTLVFTHDHTVDFSVKPQIKHADAFQNTPRVDVKRNAPTLQPPKRRLLVDIIDDGILSDDLVALADSLLALAGAFPGISVSPSAVETSFLKAQLR